MDEPKPTASSPDPHAASGLPIVEPDAGETQKPELIDNTIPTRGYHALPVVGVGGSAGSISALKQFFEATPAETGFAYVVILHLSPDYESTMPALLQRHTAMPVFTAEGGHKLQPNTVYVILPGKHLTAVDGHLRLTDLQAERGKRVAVDLFFRSPG